MPESLTANGFSLRQSWCDVENLGPLMVTGARRGENVEVPGRHGTVRLRHKRYTEARPSLPMWVLGIDPDTGLTPADPVSQLHRNLDRLLSVFHAETVELVHTRPDGSSRMAVVELAAEPTVASRERSYPPMSRVTFDLAMPDPFWADAEPVYHTIIGVSGTTGDLAEFKGATAPMSDLVIRFQGPVNNPQLNFAGGSVFVKYNGAVSAGRQLVLDTTTWQVSPGTGTSWNPDVRQVEFAPGPRWLELDPSARPFEVEFIHTGGGSAMVSIEGRRRYLTP